MVILKILFMVSGLIAVVGCDSFVEFFFPKEPPPPPPPPPKSSENLIETFLFIQTDNLGISQVYQGIIDEEKQIITIAMSQADWEVRNGAFIPTIRYSNGAKISPSLGKREDFTPSLQGNNPFSYTITAEDGTARTYQVHIMVEIASVSSVRFLAADNPHLSRDHLAIIDHARKRITLELDADEWGTGEFVPTITMPEGTTVLPVGGESQDLRSAVPYTFTSSTGSVSVYDMQATMWGDSIVFPQLEIQEFPISLTPVVDRYGRRVPGGESARNLELLPMSYTEFTEYAQGLTSRIEIASQAAEYAQYPNRFGHPVYNKNLYYKLSFSGTFLDLKRLYKLYQENGLTVFISVSVPARTAWEHETVTTPTIQVPIHPNIWRSGEDRITIIDNGVGKSVMASRTRVVEDRLVYRKWIGPRVIEMMPGVEWNLYLVWEWDFSFTNTVAESKAFHEQVFGEGVYFQEAEWTRTILANTLRDGPGGSVLLGQDFLHFTSSEMMALEGYTLGFGRPRANVQIRHLSRRWEAWQRVRVSSTICAGGSGEKKIYTDISRAFSESLQIPFVGRTYFDVSTSFTPIVTGYDDECWWERERERITGKGTRLVNWRGTITIELRDGQD